MISYRLDSRRTGRAATTSSHSLTVPIVNVGPACGEWRPDTTNRDRPIAHWQQRLGRHQRLCHLQREHPTLLAERLHRHALWWQLHRRRPLLQLLHPPAHLQPEQQPRQQHHLHCRPLLQHHRGCRQPPHRYILAIHHPGRRYHTAYRDQRIAYWQRCLRRRQRLRHLQREHQLLRQRLHRHPSGGSPISGALSYNSSTHVLTFNPSSNLTNSTTYTAALSANITDGSGNHLAATTWQFTTQSGVVAAVLRLRP